MIHESRATDLCACDPAPVYVWKGPLVLRPRPCAPRIINLAGIRKPGPRSRARFRRLVDVIGNIRNITGPARAARTAFAVCSGAGQILPGRV